MNANFREKKEPFSSHTSIYEDSSGALESGLVWFGLVGLDLGAVLILVDFWLEIWQKDGMNTYKVDHQPSSYSEFGKPLVFQVR